MSKTRKEIVGRRWADVYTQKAILFYNIYKTNGLSISVRTLIELFLLHPKFGGKSKQHIFSLVSDIVVTGNIPNK
ncbi:hypothetical protein ACJMK2_002135, partial [Sinanodonta woodiana]